MHHEDEIAYAIGACVTLNHISNEESDDGIDFEEVSKNEQVNDFPSSEKDHEKRTREALLYYVHRQTQYIT